MVLLKQFLCSAGSLSPSCFPNCISIRTARSIARVSPNQLLSRHFYGVDRNWQCATYLPSDSYWTVHCLEQSPFWRIVVAQYGTLPWIYWALMSSRRLCPQVPSTDFLSLCSTPLSSQIRRLPILNRCPPWGHNPGRQVSVPPWVDRLSMMAMCDPLLSTQT